MAFVYLLMHPLMSSAENAQEKRTLNNVEIFYMETQPAAQEAGTV